MTQFPTLAASRQTPAAAASAAGHQALLSDALFLLRQWEARFGTQVAVGSLPAATRTTIGRLSAAIGTEA